ncbi:vWA domain-containing protein [Actinokineospora fastidiosa]|uniref:VWA domain-containing protein n=1 Tax=Actinokineospora fastidiosa TaxID=1816 RepID=A0A918LH51_9PSEU|nr:hypothetical protein [Actinokineospora fastidiosa]GGS46527.1 hypothetical protein GCM10010171_47170 [Actinokineospora fastidiosa]
MNPSVLPCYVAVDESFSMSDHLDEVNAGLREFRGAVHADPAVAALVRVCVVGFADEPRVLRPLGPAADLADLSAASPRAGTNFGPLFAFLHAAIDRDVRGLKARRLPVRRPIVFLTSDGRATDRHDWPAVFAAFTDPDRPVCPNVVVFGVGATDQHTLGRIGTFRVYNGRDGVRMGTALTASVAAAASRSDQV